MKKILTSNKIYIARSEVVKAGRGVFAIQNIKKGEIIEVCPIIEIPKNDASNLRGSILVNYYFYFGKQNEKLAVALGFGSIYNHSYEPNATYNKRLATKVIEFSAVRNIKKNEEITVNYNYGNPNDKARLWIKDIPPFKK